jgi:hypothetical protein
MIDLKVLKKKHFCNEDYEKIENYEKAISDSERYVCHHRFETHTSDGEKRLVDLSVEELKALDMYFNRPAEELIFLTKAEHNSLHHKGKVCSEEQKKKLSKSMKGKNKGIREDLKGKHWRLENGKRIWFK